MRVLQAVPPFLPRTEDRNSRRATDSAAFPCGAWDRRRRNDRTGSQASSADFLGRMHPCSAFLAASSTMGNAPATSRTVPSNPNSPIIRNLSNNGRLLCAEAAMIPKAIGRSYPLPFLCMSAGARFITIFLPGILKPNVCRDVMILSRLSFMAASASRTRWMPIHVPRSTSTVTSTASIPTHFAQ